MIHWVTNMGPIKDPWLKKGDSVQIPESLDLPLAMVYMRRVEAEVKADMKNPPAKKSRSRSTSPDERLPTMGLPTAIPTINPLNSTSSTSTPTAGSEAPTVPVEQTEPTA